MDYPAPDPTEQEQIEEILAEIERGCCLGDFSETGAITWREQPLYRTSDGTTCFDVSTELLERLVEDRRVTYTVEPHPAQQQLKRRVYRVVKV